MEIYTGKIIISFLFVFLISSQVLAIPSISNVSGKVVNDQTLTIFGSNFGNHPLTIEWLGGASGNIERGTLGNAFSKSGWTVDPDTSNTYAPRYDNTRAHSGTKSIVSQYPTSQYDSGMGFDVGGPMGTVYATWWEYSTWDPVPGGVETNKIMYFWLRKDWQASGVNGGVLFEQTHENAGQYRSYTIVGPNWPNWDPGFPNSNSNYMYGGRVLPYGTWTRLEVYGKESSGANVRDGELSWSNMVPGTGVRQILYNGPWIGNIITRQNDADKWRWFAMIMYAKFGSPGQSPRGKFWHDDIYIQWGTQARVEVCDTSTWANRKHCEIQYPMSWSDGSISVTLNQGSFNGGSTAYIYVIDSKGNVSNSGQGYSITLGSNIQGASDPAPAPPKNLHVVN